MLMTKQQRSTLSLTCMWWRTWCLIWTTSTSSTALSSPGSRGMTRVRESMETSSSSSLLMTVLSLMGCMSVSCVLAALPPAHLTGGMVTGEENQTLLGSCLNHEYQVPWACCADAGLQVDHRQQGWSPGWAAGQAQGPLQCVQVGGC